MARRAGNCRRGPRAPEAVSDVGIDEVANHHASIATALPAPPVLIGHSFGGMIVPVPGKQLSEAAIAKFSPHSPAKADTDNDRRGPLLLMMGGQDNTVPEAISKATLNQCRHSAASTELVEFADRGHSWWWTTVGATSPTGARPG